MIVLDGPLGTQLASRGARVEGRAWSALAIAETPQAIAELHREYAQAGATVHTTNTFRTRRRSVGDAWEELAREAVRLCRGAIPSGHRVAGSIAPLEDCYRPDLSPPHPGPEHAELARVLAEGCDLLLVETFPHPDEALAAVEAALATGTETWLALTAGPDADLLTPREMRQCAKEAVRMGVSAISVNCTPAVHTLRFVERLAGLGVPFGAYANAGHTHDGIGWHDDTEGPERYVALARTWIDAGATIIGSCCGTGPAHVAALDALRRGSR